MAAAEVDEVAVPRVIGASQISSVLSWRELVESLRVAFRSLEEQQEEEKGTDAIEAPPRHRHSLPCDATLLLMPAWPRCPSPASSSFMGVKIVTVFPRSSPSISASYILSSSLTGTPVALLDGSRLTLWRTAAVSALASDLLSNRDPRILLMVGAGALAPFLIDAHCSVRPSISHILIWNRTHSKAASLASSLLQEKKQQQGMPVSSVSVSACTDLEQAARSADVITCATMSKQALIRGAWLKPGAHLDLVGSFAADMRECDEEAIGKSEGAVFVDSAAAVEEAGELVGMKGCVEGTLSELVSGRRPGRRNPQGITVFKSVGSAIADLAAAQLVYEKICCLA